MRIVQGPTQVLESLSRLRNIKSGRKNKMLENQMIPIVGLTLSIDSLKPVRKGFSIAWYLSIASAVRVKLGTTQRISNIVTPVNVLQRKLPISPLRLFLPPPNLPVNRPQEKAQTITNVQVNKKLVVECIERVETTM